MNYKYTFLMVEDGIEFSLYNLTQEELFQTMHDDDSLVLAKVTRIKEEV